LKNKIIIDIGSHITTVSYKKIIFEQRELFQIRKIFNEKSGRNTHIFNLLKTICKYTFSSNELNNNVLFKTYLNRIHVKYLNKNETAIKTVDQKAGGNTETNENGGSNGSNESNGSNGACRAGEAKAEPQAGQDSGSTTRYLLKNLNKTKKMNINLFFQY
jgi:hypothetical protein